MISLVRASALALTLAACSPSSTALAEVLATRSGAVNVESLARLDNPWGMSFLLDGRLLITEKPGRLRIYQRGKLSAPVGGVPKVAYRGQGGLLDVAVDPGFADNRLVYLSYAEAGDGGLKGGAVARGRLEGDALRDVTVIWRQVPKTVGDGHFGGRLVFAPDGKLFITSGDRQRFDPAQDLGSNLGKIVRVNKDGSVPPDNPFVKRRGARPDIWSLGHRNPLGAAIHPASKQLWINEMGPRGGDELDIVRRGGNYGWPVVSEGNHYDGRPIPRHRTRPGFIPPIRAWNPVISPSGMIFYTGLGVAPWHGDVLMGGLSSMELIRLTLDGGRVVDEERIAMKRRIRDVAQAPDGAVLLLSDGGDGELLRLTTAKSAAR